MTKKRILTGDNPTGRLHLGHYVGSLENRLKLQDEYETFIIIADTHAFAYPKYVNEPKTIEDAVIQVTIDNLSVGLDPTKVKFFVESAIPQVYELGILFSMLVSHARELRNPTLKDEIRDKEMGENFSMGFVNFPLLQVADIIGINADLVPVGEDQLPHLELANEVVRKFNTSYGQVFKEITPMVGRIRRLVGTDGNAKMTKSLNNTIYLSEAEGTLREKVFSMYTDPSRIHATDPGKVEGNPVFMYHDAFNPNTSEVEDLKTRYKTGNVGDREVKEKLFVALNTFMVPMREKRAYYEAHLDEAKDIIRTGTLAATKEYTLMLARAREAMRLFQ